MRNAVKKTAYSALFYSGLHRAVAKKHSRLILMYHGVTGKDLTAHFGRHLPAAQFERHLVYFKKHFRILPLDELVMGGSRQRKKHTLPAIALTFDDGFENNLTCALPLLEKHRVPATFFVTTFALNKKDCLAADLIDVTRTFTEEKTLLFNNKIYVKAGPHRLLEKKTGKNIYEELLLLSPPALKKAVLEFTGRYHTPGHLQKADPGTYRLLDEGQVKQLSSSPYASIGSHTKSHPALGTCSDAELEEELASSKKELERITGRKITSLAFPYGDHNNRVVAQSKKAGCETLLAAGKSELESVLPRLGMISAGSFEQNMVNVWKGFGRFGF